MSIEKRVFKVELMEDGGLKLDAQNMSGQDFNIIISALLKDLDVNISPSFGNNFLLRDLMRRKMEANMLPIDAETLEKEEEDMKFVFEQYLGKEFFECQCEACQFERAKESKDGLTGLKKSCKG